MPLIILLAASLVATHQVSLECVNVAAIQTPSASSPNGLVAVLKVSSEDDHSRNSHLCNAQYQLLLSSGAGDEPHVVRLLTSNGPYNRNLFLDLSGFSGNGKRVLGMLSEDGDE